MRSVEMPQTYALSEVKPLQPLLAYRRRCLDATKRALRTGSRRRTCSPIGSGPLAPYDQIDGLDYVSCVTTNSLLLAALPEPDIWAGLLADISRARQTFHEDLAPSRLNHVYAPKVEWIDDAVRLHEIDHPRILEVTTAPSRFTAVLQDSGAFAQVLTVDETHLAVPDGGADQPRVEAAVLLESLDRSHDPVALLRAVTNRLVDGGLVFVTSLVCSGFDMAVLGVRNQYFYPPDRTNCFTLQGLSALVRQAGLTLLEVSTPGVLDVEIVRAHAQADPALPLSVFERQLVTADETRRAEFQTFLQQQGFSSFARLVAKKQA